MTGAALLALRAPESLAEPLPPGAERARAYAAQARAPNTLRAYGTAWRAFRTWCEARGDAALPAEPVVLAAYLAELADRGRAWSGICIVLAAVGEAHRAAGYSSPAEDPVVRETRKGIRRTIGTAQHGKAALLVEGLCRAVQALPPDLRGARDRALLLLGWSGAFRRAELVALEVSDVREVPEGLEITIRRSKTDQEGRGRLVPIPRGTRSESCPVSAVLSWRAQSGITEGPLFRPINRWKRLSDCAISAGYVASLVKRCAELAGVPARELGGHSLRSGFVTTACKAGKTMRSIMAVTGHRSVSTVERYNRRARLFDDAASSGLGL